MYLDFLSGLLLLGFVFSLLTALLGIPIAALLTPLSSIGDPAHDYRTAVIQQAIVNVVYAGLIAVAVVLYIDRAPVESGWIYALTGFTVVFGVLGSNMQDRAQEASQSINPSDHAIAEGAGLGFLLGLVGYWLFYLVPDLFLIIPGAELLMNWTIGASRWLIGFGFVQVVLLLFAGLWLLNTGLSILMWSGMAIAAGVGALTGSADSAE